MKLPFAYGFSGFVLAALVGVCAMIGFSSKLLGKVHSNGNSLPNEDEHLVMKVESNFANDEKGEGLVLSDQRILAKRRKPKRTRPQKPSRSPPVSIPVPALPAPAPRVPNPAANIPAPTGSQTIQNPLSMEIFGAMSTDAKYMTCLKFFGREAGDSGKSDGKGGKSDSGKSGGKKRGGKSGAIKVSSPTTGVTEVRSHGQTRRFSLFIVFHPLFAIPPLDRNFRVFVSPCFRHSKLV